MNNKEDMKEKNLKQIGIIVVLIILLALIGYNVQDNFEIDYRTGEAKLLE